MQLLNSLNDIFVKNNPEPCFIYVVDTFSFQLTNKYVDAINILDYQNNFANVGNLGITVQIGTDCRGCQRVNICIDAAQIEITCFVLEIFCNGSSVPQYTEAFKIPNGKDLNDLRCYESTYKDYNDCPNEFFGELQSEGFTQIDGISGTCIYSNKIWLNSTWEVTEQTIEPNYEGICNSHTGVEKSESCRMVGLKDLPYHVFKDRLFSVFGGENVTINGEEFRIKKDGYSFDFLKLYYRSPFEKEYRFGCFSLDVFSKQSSQNFGCGTESCLRVQTGRCVRLGNCVDSIIKGESPNEFDNAFCNAMPSNPLLNTESLTFVTFDNWNTYVEIDSTVTNGIYAGVPEAYEAALLMSGCQLLEGSLEITITPENKIEICIIGKKPISICIRSICYNHRNDNGVALMVNRPDGCTYFVYNQGEPDEYEVKATPFDHILNPPTGGANDFIDYKFELVPVDGTFDEWEVTQINGQWVANDPDMTIVPYADTYAKFDSPVYDCDKLAESLSLVPSVEKVNGNEVFTIIGFPEFMNGQNIDWSLGLLEGNTTINNSQTQVVIMNTDCALPELELRFDFIQDCTLCLVIDVSCDENQCYVIDGFNLGECPPVEPECTPCTSITMRHSVDERTEQFVRIITTYELDPDCDLSNVIIEPIVIGGASVTPSQFFSSNSSGSQEFFINSAGVFSGRYNVTVVTCGVTCTQEINLPYDESPGFSSPSVITPLDCQGETEPLVVCPLDEITTTGNFGAVVSGGTAPYDTLFELVLANPPEPGAYMRLTVTDATGSQCAIHLVIVGDGLPFSDGVNFADITSGLAYFSAISDLSTLPSYQGASSGSPLIDSIVPENSTNLTYLISGGCNCN